MGKVAACALVLMGVWSIPAAAAGAAEARQRADACRALARYQPSPDVVHQPGVDVRGQPVAPADLEAARQPGLPEEIRIAITVDLAERLGIPPKGDQDFVGEVEVGTVVVDPEGRVFLNGQPLTNLTEAELAALCREAGGTR
ncbi:MAG: hypothetical protein ACE5Q3_02290 [Alphaproteobacteria bacterium]